MPKPINLPPGQQLAAPGKWPLVGEKTPGELPADWTIELVGAVRKPEYWTIEQLASFPQVERTVDVHCVTRWSKLGMQFRGVLLATLLGECLPLPSARYVSFVAYSSRDHSTSLSLADCLQLDVLIALRAEGEPLTLEHGGPARIITPGRYFYKSLKWLKRIELLNQDRLGYWEQEAGYHNHADPWLEQRYLAPTLNKRDAAHLIALRDFRGRDLRGIYAAGCDLRRLNASGSLLRDADFRGADLRDANFERANLSNAHCERADLRRAVLQAADLEGANLEGADLRGTNLHHASLFGATFVSADGNGAQLDSSTSIDDSSIDQLAPVQAEFVRTQLWQPPT